MNSKTKDRYLFILGIAICFGVASLSVFLEKIIPGDLLGAENPVTTTVTGFFCLIF